MKPYILTYTGRQFWFDDMIHNEISIVDIAHALANTCRFGGHTTTFYSVAQHSILVSHLVPDRLAFAALMHDAAEAYLGDIPTPVKQLLPDYQALEKRVQNHINALYEIDTRQAEIKIADTRILAREREDLMLAADYVWLTDVLDISHLAPIEPWSPDKAEEEFMKQFERLVF